MGSCTLELVLHSAKDLKDVKNFSAMSPHAEIWIVGGGKDSPRYKTKAATEAGTCPVWNSSMEFKLDPTKNYVLFIKIIHSGSFFNREIGDVKIPLNDLLMSAQKASYPVKSDMPPVIVRLVMGEITLSHKFSEPLVAGKHGNYMKRIAEGMGKEVLKEVGKEVATQALAFAAGGVGLG